MSLLCFQKIKAKRFPAQLQEHHGSLFMGNCPTAALWNGTRGVLKGATHSKNEAT